MAEGLELCDVAILRHGRALLRVDAAVRPGQVLTVMGPSGSGKSTLLDHLMGELPPGFVATGELRLDGRVLDGLPPQARRIGILYQDPLLFPHLDVAGNLLFGLPRGGTRAARRGRVEAALAEAGLGGLAARDPATLSGGQAARVALMRTLLGAPRALLLDEPFGKLDADRRDRMRTLTFARARAAGIPVVLVTHDDADARAAGGPVLRIGDDG